MRTWRSAISSHLALAAFSSARTSSESWSIRRRRWAPTTSSSISQPRCWRSTPKCDSAFSSAPTLRMFSSQYSAASRAKRSARSSSTPGGRRRAAVLLAEHVGEDRAEVDGGAARLRDLGRQLAVLALRLASADARRGDAQVDVAQRRIRRPAARRPARRTAAAGCRSARPRSTVCTRSRFLARASPSAALWKPARRSTRRRSWTSSWPRTWARLIAGSHTGIRLFTR